MVHFLVQEKITQVQGQKSEKQSISLDWCLIALDRLKVAYLQKISKRRKPITWPSEAQILIHFFWYLKDIIS